MSRTPLRTTKLIPLAFATAAVAVGWVDGSVVFVTGSLVLGAIQAALPYDEGEKDKWWRWL